MGYLARSLAAGYACAGGTLGGGLMPAAFYAVYEKASGGDGSIVLCEHPWLLVLCLLSAFVTGSFCGAGVERLLEQK